MEKFNPVMHKPDLAGSYCKAACRHNTKTSEHKVVLKLNLPSTVKKNVSEWKGEDVDGFRETEL